MLSQRKRDVGGARKAALASGQKQYFTGLLCKNGHSAPRQTSNGKCVACEKSWAESNRDYCRAQVKKSEQKSLEKKNARIRAWAKNNPHKKNAKEARRRAAVIFRTPHWLSSDDKWLMEEAYALAALRTTLFGFVWHVDHIVPLQGKNVSGLHVPNNLQVIPGRDNLHKTNRHEVL